MYGVVTRNEDETGWPEFDRGFYEVKDVSGRGGEPIADAVNMVSCFGDNAAVRGDPSLAAVNADGEPATRERPYFDWSYVCPTHERYREGLLETIVDCAAAEPDVRLDDVGFPREGYCRCDRCDRLFDESPYADRDEWREAAITEFVEDAVDRIPGRSYLTLYPDPYPDHLSKRSGLDVDALADVVDEFVVPLYDLDYGTTYWLESIARGFRSRLGGSYDPDGEPSGVPFSVELYAVDVDVENLAHATDVANRYAKDVFFGYDASQAAATIRRLRAEESDEGETHRPDE
ncbi:hypothetical protein AArcSl_0772 [Halalkaliarchaeum desulfuricum]|uniref:Glycoside hydrolase domain protein n=1 Tax=Halalkaliarchaeum desulfuricum TaxID=2055893 RepID=A0A343TH46_9EURY|nr:hypothetical protein [Halalkaliarchaeum desulfuricum]AUX08418.1 hypothetical protein AArcSl_0772 [Halalkaliarchaeum desulfuricum]